MSLSILPWGYFARDLADMGDQGRKPGTDRRWGRLALKPLAAPDHFIIRQMPPQSSLKGEPPPPRLSEKAWGAGRNLYGDRRQPILAL